MDPPTHPGDGFVRQCGNFTLVYSMLAQLYVTILLEILRERTGSFVVARLAPLFCTTIYVFLRILRRILQGCGTGVRAMYP